MVIADMCMFFFNRCRGSGHPLTTPHCSATDGLCRLNYSSHAHA